jgi:hypothetical protein
MDGHLHDGVNIFGPDPRRGACHWQCTVPATGSAAASSARPCLASQVALEVATEFSLHVYVTVHVTLRRTLTSSHGGRQRLTWNTNDYYHDDHDFL